MWGGLGDLRGGLGEQRRAGRDGPGGGSGAWEKGFEGLRSHGANIVWDTAVGKVLVHFVPSGVG